MRPAAQIKTNGPNGKPAAPDWAALTQALPPAQVASYVRGKTIYRAEETADQVSLIASGRVKLSRVCQDGREAVLEILKPGELLGELAALWGERRREQAQALDAVELQTWPSAVWRAQMEKDARWGTALAVWLGRRVQAAYTHIESLAFDPIPRRLARTMLENALRFGTRLEDGRLQLGPLTHEALAQQVATSREIITHYMNQFRQQGLLDYSRKSIEVVPERLETLLQ